MGDKTQLSILLLSSRTREYFRLLLGVMLAFLLADGIAILVGSWVTNVIPVHLVKLASGLVFIFFGILILKGCFRRSKIDPLRRSNFDPLFKLTNHPVNKVHVSLPSPKTLSVHVQDHCVMGNPIENCSCKGSVMEYLHPVRESQIRCNDSTHRLVSSCQQLKK
jgi:hypothetical protein